jgi:hypothetical protein
LERKLWWDSGSFGMLDSDLIDLGQVLPTLTGTTCVCCKSGPAWKILASLVECDGFSC